MTKLAILGASGKLGFATLNALLDHDLIPATDLVCTTSSSSGASKLAAAGQRGVSIRSANWDDPASFATAFHDCDKLFLISSARIEKDYDDAAPGHGREADHFAAIDAARAAGIQHIYYTSLAFANPSRSNVMTAHERTEAYLRTAGVPYTVIREGLYSESWPLYFGHYDFPHDERAEIVVGGDGDISWTSIADLGLASALILAAPAATYAGRTLGLSHAATHSLRDVAEIVSGIRGRKVAVKVVPREEHERFYTAERGMEGPAVRWWSKTYDALAADECGIRDPTLGELLASRGRKPTEFAVTVEEMFRSAR